MEKKISYIYLDEDDRRTGYYLDNELVGTLESTCLMDFLEKTGADIRKTRHLRDGKYLHFKEVK